MTDPPAEDWTLPRIRALRDDAGNPPARTEAFQTADPGMSERWITLIFADGRSRAWASERGGAWLEIRSPAPAPAVTVVSVLRDKPRNPRVPLPPGSLCWNTPLVRWVANTIGQPNHVECRQMHGRVFPLDSLPQHWIVGCRCRLVPSWPGELSPPGEPIPKVAVDD